MIETGPLYGAKAMAWQAADYARNNKQDPSWAMLMVGAITVAIGAVMVGKNASKLWADHVKQQAKSRSRVG